MSNPTPAGISGSAVQRVADSESADPAHRARIDRLLESTAFATTLDRMFAAAADQPPSDDPQAARDAETTRIVLSYATWRYSAELWRKVLADGLSAADADDIIAYYDSPGGRTLVDCQRRASDPLSLSACAMSLGDEDQAAYFDFIASPAGRAWDDLGNRAVMPVMKKAVCAGLRREPEMVPRLDEICRRDPRAMCELVRRADHALPEIDPAVCAATQTTKGR